MNARIAYLLNVKENATQGRNNMDLTKKISPYVLLADIFDNLNSKICSDCPEAKELGKNIWEWRTKKCGCCTGCAYKEGHLGHSENDLKFSSLKKYFTKTYGFFSNKHKCCKLPREKRSYCCQHYTCSSMRKVLVEKHGNQILDFIEDLCNQIEHERAAKNSSLLCGNVVV